MQTADGEITLFGVFNVYQEEIASNWGWNDRTVEQYRLSLQNTIIPCVDSHNARPIGSYTPEFMTQVLNRIEECKCQKCQGDGYAPETLKRFRHIMAVTVRTAILHMLCPDVWKDPCNSIRRGKSEHARPVRFFSPADDLRIIQYIRKNARSSGAMRGLYIMMCTRCRENEAAGLTWGNIRDNEENPQLLTVYLLESTELQSNDNKLGGKTDNAPRSITLTLDQSEFVRNLRKILEEKWRKRGGNASGFNRLRVAARKNNLWNACRSRHLSEAANMMFSKLKLTDAVETLNRNLASGAIEYAENPDYWETPPETSATCYTLRRAAATFDRVLGIDMDDRQYLMGHAVSRTAYDHCFRDAKHQCEIAKQSADRPGVNTICLPISQLCDTLENKDSYCDIVATSKNNDRIVGMVSTIEPGDRIRLEVRATKPCKLTVKSSVLQPHQKYSWRVNVKRKLHKLYENAEKEI